MLTAKEERWIELMANLEGVVTVAHKMMREGELTEEVYTVFNNRVADLEYLARDVRDEWFA